MDCKLFKEKISLYIDEQLSEIDKKEFELHLLSCDNCKVEYENMLKIVKEVRKEESVELPENFKSELREKLLNIDKDKKRVNWKLFSTVAAVLVVFIFVASIGFIPFDMDKVKNDMQYTMDIGAEESGKYGRDVSQEPAAPEIMDSNMNENLIVTAKSNMDMATDIQESDDSQSTADIKEGRKIIKNAYLSIEVENYDKVFNNIVTFIKNQNGYIENSNTSYIVNNYNKRIEDNKDKEDEVRLKQGSMLIRVPENKYEDTLNFLRKTGEVTSENSNEIDLTKSYLDKENIIKNLQIQEERLREILKEAKNVDEILRVENELRRIRTEIDNHTAVLKDWDDKITLSTITVSLIEVEKIDQNIKKIDDNIWTKAKKGFITTINKLINLVERMFIGIITILPIIIILAIIIIIIYFLAKKFLYKYKNKQE